MIRRRSLLEMSALGVASVSLAGCLERDGGTDDTENEVDGSTFDGDYEEIARWLPAPDVLDVDPYRINAVAPAALAKYDDVLEEGTTELLTDLFDELAVSEPGPETVDRGVSSRYGDMLSPSAPSSVVIKGSFDTAAMASTLENGGYDLDRTEGEYEIYEQTDENDRDEDAYAVGEDVLISSRGTRASDILEAIIDAERGDVDRYADAHDGFRRLAAILPAGHVAIAGPTESDEQQAEADEGPLGSAVADGTVLQVTGNETLEGGAVAYEETSGDDQELEDLLDELDAEADSDDSTYGVDDGVVWFYGTRPTEDVAF